MTISQEITELPPAPQRTDPPAVFVPKADAHVASLDQFVTEINTFGDQVNTTQGEINSSAANAAASEANAAASETAAVAAANFKGLWSNLTGALSVPATVEHNGVNWQLLNNLADVTASEPGVTADWSEVNPSEVIKLTGGGDLSAAQPNEIQDAGTYDLPLAANYSNGKFVDVLKPEALKANQPLIQRKAASSDLIEYSGGTDTDLQMDQNNSEFIRFVSNGVDRWRI